jgi:DNA-binding NtrC family response regulator
MKSLRILVAEDDDLISELLAEVLVCLGHSVCGIEITEEGLIKAAQRLKPCLMIVDKQLAMGCGIAAIDAIIRERYIPHILVSGNIAAIAAIRPNAIMLAKPYNQSGLSQAISLAVDYPAT